MLYKIHGESILNLVFSNTMWKLGKKYVPFLFVKKKVCKCLHCVCGIELNVSV